MAGTIKLDGTQFLEKVNNEFKITNSELKLKSTGNTIVDSSGNAVVSESGGVVTLNNGTIGSGVVFPTFVGMIASFAMSSAPSGWVVCNGAEYAIADYGDLHTAIGTTWGALTNGSGGAGSTHFRVPDLRGAFLRGIGQHGTYLTANLSGFAGPSVGNFEYDQMQGHKHDFTIDTRSTVGTDPTRVANGAPTTYIGLSGTTSNPVTDSTNGTPRVGDETRPFNAGINYCIKY